MLRVSKEDGASENGLFIESDRANNIKGTKLTAKWLNAVQDEICNVIESRFGQNSLNENNNQLLLSVQDLVDYGSKTIKVQIENGKMELTNLPLILDSKKFIVATFYSYSERKAFQQPPLTWVIEHFAAYNRYSESWTLLSTRFGNIDDRSTQPHALSVVPTTGQIQYTTSQMNTKEYEGSMILSHFRFVRANS